MNPERYQRAKKLFLAAVEVPPEERSRFLHEACAGDETLRVEVASMLADHYRAQPDGQETVAVATSSARRSEPATPERIGPYHILSVIGEGGMGTVYLAEQEKPMRRRVALKIIKLGMDTRQVIARFEAEREALALMNHPHVARVFDAGATETGRPFFVMEYVEGVPLTAYCDAGRLSMLQRLELFVQVCQAIQHAHQKGIIHRDIKPSNVLVTEVDGKPAVKVIDFGIAKATHQRLTETTCFTEQGQLIGTPAYMSPEQADVHAADIDTRTDIYSLGVLLYEMLVGALPFDSAELRRAALTEIVRIIQEVDPQRPSSRLASLGAMSTTIADLRSTSTGTLARLLRGDLDWIVMKCLEKDRTRRYETANAIVLEIQRYLRNEPVLAGPPSAAYRLRKFVRRNRVPVTAATAVMLALMAGLSFAIFGLVEARTQRRAAETALAAERVALHQAEVARDEAAQRAKETDQVAQFQAQQLAEINVSALGAQLRRELGEKVRAAFLRSGAEESQIEAKVAELNTLVADADFTGLGLSLVDANILARTQRAIETQFTDQPLVRARLLQSLATTARDMSLFDRATEAQELALQIRIAELGEEHLSTVYSIGEKARLLGRQGKYAEAEPLFLKELEWRRRDAGPDNTYTLIALGGLGFLYDQQGKFAESEKYYQEAVDGWIRTTGLENKNALHAKHGLARALIRKGQLEEAEAHFREVLQIRRRLLGNLDPSTLISLNDMGWVLNLQHRQTEAIPYLREALQGNRSLYGDEGRETLTTLANLGAALETLWRLDEVEPCYVEVLAARKRIMGPDHPDTLISQFDMGTLRARQGRFVESEQLLRDVLARRRKVLGDTHHETLSTALTLAGALAMNGQAAEAEPILREFREIYRNSLGEDRAFTVQTSLLLALVLRTQGQIEEAKAIADDAIPRARKVFRSNQTLGRFLQTYGLILISAGRWDEAAAALEEAYEKLQGSQSAFLQAKLQGTIKRLVDVYDALENAKPGLGFAQKAEKLRAELEARDSTAIQPFFESEYGF